MNNTEFTAFFDELEKIGISFADVSGAWKGLNPAARGAIIGGGAGLAGGLGAYGASRLAQRGKPSLLRRLGSKLGLVKKPAAGQQAGSALKWGLGGAALGAAGGALAGGGRMLGQAAAPRTVGRRILG